MTTIVVNRNKRRLAPTSIPFNSQNSDCPVKEQIEKNEQKSSKRQRLMKQKNQTEVNPSRKNDSIDVTSSVTIEDARLERKRLKKRRQREKRKLEATSIKTLEKSTSATSEPINVVKASDQTKNGSKKPMKEIKMVSNKPDFLGNLWDTLGEQKRIKKEKAIIAEEKELKRQRKRAARERKRKQMEKTKAAKPMYFTEEGLPIYSVESLNIGKGVDGPDCPFDCWCCF